MDDQFLIGLQDAVYHHGTPRGDVVRWDYFDDGTEDNGVVYGLKIVHGVTVVAFRGSVTWLDWARDLFAFTLPVNYGGLGPVHPGFAIGIQDVWRKIQSVSAGPYVNIGHSLGAARATLLTALMVRDGIVPIARVCWGEPKSGFEKLRSFVEGIPSRSYCNIGGMHRDTVTTLPYKLPLEAYEHVAPLIELNVGPQAASIKDLGHVFSLHHLDLYRKSTPETPVQGVL